MSKSQNRPETVLSGKGVASITKNTGYLLGTRGLNHVVRFVYVIALAHYLGPEIYGILNYAMSWYLTFLPLTGLGIAAILSREIGRYRNCGVQLVSQTLILRICVTVITAVACGIVGWFVEGKPEVKTLLVVFSVALIGRSLATWSQSVFTAYESNQYTFRLQAMFRTFEILLGIALLIVGGGAIAVAIVHLISWWLQALSGLAMIRHNLVAIQLKWSWQSMKNLLAQGLPIGLAVFMLNWMQMGPLVLFRHMNDSEYGLGQLALALQAFLILGSIPMVVGTASLPVLSRAAERQDGKDLLFTEILIRAAFILGGVGGLLGICAGPFLIDVIFGVRYSEAGHLLGVVMWLLIPWTCGNAIWRMYLAKGQVFSPILCSGAGALALSLTFRWFVSSMHTTGAVMATGIGLGVWMLSSIWVLARSGELNVSLTIARPLTVILLAIGVFIVLMPLNNWLALILSLATIFSGTLLFGVVTSHERHMVLSLSRRWFSSSIFRCKTR